LRVTPALLRLNTITNTKVVLKKRNRDIYADYREGMSISELSQKYYLAEKSMSRIIKQENGKK